ncbi:hypothetical protein BD779DRAFT_1676816 [Infundibulicybe gibba]|nr:hypothetical protein BD779DRAFT_1676816 [Infundibulicybe gibba]
MEAWGASFRSPYSGLRRAITALVIDRGLGVVFTPGLAVDLSAPIHAHSHRVTSASPTASSDIPARQLWLCRQADASAGQTWIKAKRAFGLDLQHAQKPRSLATLVADPDPTVHFSIDNAGGFVLRWSTLQLGDRTAAHVIDLYLGGKYKKTRSHLVQSGDLATAELPRGYARKDMCLDPQFTGMA